MPNKALTLRLPEEKAAELAAVAQADNMHVSDAVREAIDNHIATRRADQDLQKRLKRREASQVTSPVARHQRA